MNQAITRRNKLTTAIFILFTLFYASHLFAATDFAVPPGRAAFPVLMTVGPDHNLWFTENTGLKIGRITPTGIITEFPIAHAQALTGIAVGSDGNIWFTDEFAGFIGHISTSGTGLMTFSLPPNSHPQGLAAGPDGNLWFVDNGETGSISLGFKLGKITTTGLITEYRTGVDAGVFDAEDYPPANITAGPDGNLWFTNPQLGRTRSAVGKITTSGQVTLYDTLDVPLAITSAADGNLWVTEYGSVAKITTAGVETQYGPLAGTGWSGITRGPDGNVWFTEARRVAYVTPNGVITELPRSEFAAFVYLTGICSGPDGALWFLGNTTSNIGRVTPGGVLTNTYTLNTGSLPSWSTIGPDGAVWFTERHFDQNHVDQIGRIDVNGVITSCPTARGSMPGGIVTGPEGNLWFLEQGTYNVAKMTTSCSITEYSIGQTSPGLWEITNGPDGNLWFPEYAAAYNNIVRITTNGVMTAFPIPTPAAQAMYATTGPDGNVWFTEYLGQNVAKLDLNTLQITEYPYPGSGKPPESIVTGPDGNLWIMIGSAFGAIAKFSTSGNLLAEYVAQFQTLNDIRVGADGAMWFDQYYPNGVGRITTSGVVSVVPLTAPNALGGTPTTGSDGKLWVTEAGAGAIARMSAIGGAGNSIIARRGIEFARSVASFVDGTPNASQADFAANIDWGDRDRGPGTVAGPAGGPFTVSGSHTYQRAGTYRLTITLHDNVDNTTYTASPGVAHVH